MTDTTIDTCPICHKEVNVMEHEHPEPTIDSEEQGASEQPQSGNKPAIKQVDNLNELLDATWAYGVDWTEHKDKSEADHEVSVYAAQIKSEMKAKFKTAITNLMSQEANKARAEAYDQALYDSGYLESSVGPITKELVISTREKLRQALTADKESNNG